MWPVASESVFNTRQKVIRDLEWKEAERLLSHEPRGRLLDVGCGTGYAMTKARALGYEVTGIEPSEATWGVKYAAGEALEILHGVAEEMPFADASFDVVYSSHALEHFTDRERGLREIDRVLRPNGLALIIVPTGTMALVSSVSQLAFTTHLRAGRFLLRSRSRRGLREILLPPAHGCNEATTWSEIGDFSVARWRALLARFFRVEDVVRPYFYPYPDFPQVLPIVRSSRFSSSAFFVCRKR